MGPPIQKKTLSFLSLDLNQSMSVKDLYNHLEIIFSFGRSWDNTQLCISISTKVCPLSPMSQKLFKFGCDCIILINVNMSHTTFAFTKNKSRMFCIIQSIEDISFLTVLKPPFPSILWTKLII